jgi:hypothetical protein
MNLLQRLLALALLLASLGACAHPQGPVADDPAARAAVLDYYAQLRRAVAQRDALALKGLYEESFTHTHGSGKVDGRDARIVSLMTAEPTVEMREDHDIVLEPYEGRVVVVRGKGPILNVKENQLYQFRWVQVLLKRDGRWRMAVSQATRLPDAPTPNPDRK